jgi:acyl-CoA thioesterase
MGAPSLGVKWPRHEADHSPPSSAEVKECVEQYLHSPNTSSWHLPLAYLTHEVLLWALLDLLLVHTGQILTATLNESLIVSLDKSVNFHTDPPQNTWQSNPYLLSHA